jgi:hypothetical protein
MVWNVSVAGRDRTTDRWLLVAFLVVFVIGLVVSLVKWANLGWHV